MAPDSIKIDPYKVLGVEPTATVEEIKQAFRALAREKHPDKVGQDDERSATNEFQTLSMAYTLLMDPVKRNQYDKWRKSGGSNQAAQSKWVGHTMPAQSSSQSSQSGQSGQSGQSSPGVTNSAIPLSFVPLTPRDAFIMRRAMTLAANYARQMRGMASNPYPSRMPRVPIHALPRGHGPIPAIPGYYRPHVGVPSSMYSRGRSPGYPSVRTMRSPYPVPGVAVSMQSPSARAPYLPPRASLHNQWQR